jgi:hypothetical protein
MPLGVDPQGNVRLTGMWPPVQKEHWCGEHKPDVLSLQ